MRVQKLGNNIKLPHDVIKNAQDGITLDDIGYMDIIAENATDAIKKLLNEITDDIEKTKYKRKMRRAMITFPEIVKATNNLIALLIRYIVCFFVGHIFYSSELPWEKECHRCGEIRIKSDEERKSI